MHTDDPDAPVGVYAVCSAAMPAQPAVQPVSWVPPEVPVRLLAKARKLDADHRAATGKPISRDALRARMRIGRDRASALTAATRAEAAARTEPGLLQRAA